jgi:NADPH:quinone reductase-like Zn-dependent oxidoreductase
VRTHYAFGLEREPCPPPCSASIEATEFRKREKIMTSTFPSTGLELRSIITGAGELELSLVNAPVPTPKADEVVVRVEAAPINPSDLGLLLGPADLSTAVASVQDGLPLVKAQIPQGLMKAIASRLDQSMPVGNEGAGVVVVAGDSPEAQALNGKTVAVIGGTMYSQYRCVRARDCLALPADATPADGASAFVNPLTSLSMVETMRMEGHKALVHTAAASNLGQMLNRICLNDGVGLVNIVRDAKQAELLRGLGARHVCNSSAPSFVDDLNRAIAETEATLAFDAIGGGALASQILTAMEITAARAMPAYSRYGSSVHKQVYIYGGLDTRPTELRRSYGMAWGVGGWLLFPFLQRLGAEKAAKLRGRVVAELKTTFASHYSHIVSLQEVLQIPNLLACNRRATGEKFLIAPHKAG